MYLGYTANEPQIIAPPLAANSKPARKPKAVKSDKPKVPDSMVTNQTGGLQPAMTGRKGKTAGRKASNNTAEPAVMNSTMMQAPYSSYPAAPSLNTSSGFPHHQPQPNYSSNYSNSKIMPPNGGGGGNQAYYQGGQYQVPPQQQQQQQPQSQQSNYYQNGQATSNQNWTSGGSDESYTHQFNPNHQQQHSGVTLSNNNSNKNSPLEYLERLALMPEAHGADQKSMLSNSGENACDNNDDPSNSRVKRNLKEVNNGSSNHDSSFMMSSTPPKKQCSSSSSGSNSNSPINGNKSMPYNNSSMFINNGGDFVNPRYTNSLNDSSPASTCSNTSSVSSASQLSHGNASGGSSSLNVTMNALNASSSSSSSSSGSNCNESAGLVSANLIDACNFDFFDLLPELNSSAIDQAINPGILNDQPSAQSSNTSTNNNATSNNSSSSSSSSTSANEFNLTADQYFNGEQNINFNTYNPF